jgi:ribosomal protein S6
MKIYELTYLIPLDLTEEETRDLQERVCSFISEKEGVLERVEDAAKIRAGSPVKGQEMVLMANASFHFEPANLDELTKKLKSEKQILRYLINIRKTHKIEVPRKMPRIMTDTQEAEEKTTKITEKPKKVEIKEIEKKLEEILGE